MASLSGSSQAIATTKEKQKASYRTLSDILHLGPRLADPKSCCGELYCTFGNGDNCWEATNEVQRIYNVSMRCRIDEILKDTQEFWAQSAKCTHFFCHSIYMVGSEKEKSKPVIFFCCKNASLRIKARNAVKEHLDMSEYPSFRFGHAPVPPGPTTPLRLATGKGAVGESHLSTFRTVFLKRPVKALCGVQVIIEAVPVGRHWVEATVGGVISLEGKYFGLTVAHGLVDDLTSPEEMEEERDWLFEYDSIDDDNISSVAKTAQKYSRDEEKEVKSLPLESSVIKTQEEHTYTPLESRITKGKEVEDPPCEFLGAIGPTSINDSSLGLDWALVEIVYDRIDSVNEFWVENSAVSDESRPEGLNNSRYRKFKSIRISGIMQSIPPEPSVLAIMGRCPPVRGTISGTILSMKLPGATDMCEVWNVQLNGVIESGDCGTFVVDSNTGNLYGFIVAGNIGTGFGYIMPAYKVQIDITRRFGRPFTLPTTEQYIKSRLSAEEELGGVLVGLGKGMDGLSDAAVAGTDVNSDSLSDSDLESGSDSGMLDGLQDALFLNLDTATATGLPWTPKLAGPKSPNPI
ncbi:hypothetical protein L207DRAFT_640596 [Hyaloscypha variabilis F]|uniref:Uncharacterized protein n=1 Tax=Hyaloscypha variabilis (strain UAMH 11265 / GT02V1 / F) TaxID=1149755 RepID=A0A2J6QZX0_HYAVF|nr:hypothetical protein L207DRAFT_640596 [Hyaloscypha variabilis F]